MTGLLRSAWNAPGAAPPPPRRVWRDWALVVLVVLTAVFEAVLRTDLSQPLVAAIIGIAVAPTLLWRRTRPLLMLAITFGTVAFGTVLLGDSVPYTSGFVIFTLYALFRWGNGRALVVGSGILLANLVVSALTGTGLGDLIGEAAFFAIVLTLGVALRFRARARMRELDRAKLMERETLARDLHDTVAHHVSAIAIRAQAGLAVAELKPELAPGRSLTDIEQLASEEVAGPRVDVRVTGDTESIPPTVAAAVYRMAQESVTNARRHARGASVIDVVVEADKGGVRLRVTNDGEVVPAATPGYGITGMMERAALLGGTCQSGRAPGGGWVVTAVLPRVGWTT